MQRAIATSLLVITLISSMGVATHLASGGIIPWFVTIPFLVGSLVGLTAGTALARRLAGPQLQRVLAAAVVAVGVFVVARNLWSY